MDVIEADAVQEFERLAHARHRLEEVERLLDRHVEHVGDGFAAEQNFQRFAVVALAVADVAGDVDIGQKVHLDLDHAVALASLAAPAFDVEREAAGLITARAALGQAGKPLTNRREGAGIGRGIAARRAADRRLVDVDDLVEMLDAFDAIVRGRALAGIVQPARQRLVQRIDQQRRLATAGHAGDAGEQAERNFGGDIFEIVAARADDFQRPRLIFGAAFRDRDHQLAGEIFAGPGVRRRHQVVDAALCDHVAAVDAGAGADVQHPVGGADGVLVVLDHDHGVAEVAQALERFQKPGIVALVQPDGGLVEHVEHAGQAGADLRGQPDALAFAAGQRARGAGEGEIFQSDIDQKFQPLADFFEHADGNFVLLRGQPLGQLSEPLCCAFDRHIGDFADMLAADLHAQSLGLEPIAFAGVAGHVGEIARDLLARPIAVGLLVAPLEIGHDAFEGALGIVGAHAVVVGKTDLGVAGAVQDGVLRFLRQILPLGVEREFVVLAQRGQRLHVIGRARFRPRRDGALAQRAVLVGDDEIGVDMLLDAEPTAFRAGAERIVEREQPRLDLGDGEAGHRAGEFFGEDEALGGFVALLIGFAVGRGGGGRRGIGKLRDRHAFGELQRLLERIRKPCGDVRPHHDAVDDDVDVVGEFLVERRRLGDLVKLAVDFDALVALLHELGELLAILALPPAHDWSQEIETSTLRERHDAVDHLRHGLALDRQSGGRRVRDADARPQQPHVVVDFGDGADGRARIARGGFLLDGDGGGEAVDLVDVRLLHHFQKLPRVSRQALDIAALALGIDGVEGERGFAGAGQAGEHHQPVARNIEVDILEVMLARAADRNHPAILPIVLSCFLAILHARIAGLRGFVEQVVHLKPALKAMELAPRRAWRGFGRANRT